MSAELVGSWQKVPGDACSERYPDELELRERGVYVGRRDGGQRFTLWDAGSWEVVGERTVRISTANDAEIAYEFALAGDSLRFVDEEGCRFEYRRVS